MPKAYTRMAKVIQQFETKSTQLWSNCVTSLSNIGVFSIGGSNKRCSALGDRYGRPFLTLSKILAAVEAEEDD
jgi:hypothetical protein